MTPLCLQSERLQQTKLGMYHTALDARFDVKHHSYLSTAEPLTYCGTRISRDAAGQVCMDNVAFVEKMLLEWGLVGCNPVRVPITKGTMTRLDDAMKQELFYGKEECTEFRSLLGMLHWLAATTMPKLVVAHSLLAKYTATPVEGCTEALYVAARFAADCQNECLLFGFGNAVGLKLFTDSDWAGLHSSTGEVYSISGGLITLGDYPVDWWSQKQKSIATSSADAESRALDTGVSRGLELQYHYMLLMNWESQHLPDCMLLLTLLLQSVLQRTMVVLPECDTSMFVKAGHSRSETERT